MKNLFLILTLSVMLVACSDGTNEQMAATTDASEQIAVTFENYNQAETARNFNN